MTASRDAETLTATWDAVYAASAEVSDLDVRAELRAMAGRLTVMAAQKATEASRTCQVCGDPLNAPSGAGLSANCVKVHP